MKSSTKPRRPKGLGTWGQRPDTIRASDGKRVPGLYFFAKDLGVDPVTKKRARRYIYGKSRKEVERKLADETARGGGTIKVPERDTVGAYLEQWLENSIKPNRRATTYELYRGLLKKHVITHVAEIKLATFDGDSVQALYNAMRAAGASASVMNSCSRILHAAFGARQRQRGMPNPFDLLERPKYQAREVRPLTIADAQAFLRAARNSPIEPVFVLALTIGLRVGEALALRWDDIDWNEKTIRIERTLIDVKGHLDVGPPKTPRSRRQLELPKIALEALRRRRKRWETEALTIFYTDGAETLPPHRSEYVCTGLKGHLLSPSYVRRLHLKEVLESAGIPHTTMHALRHTYSTLSAQQGTALKTIGDVMGHAKPSVTLATYQHTDRAAQRVAIDRLDRALSRPSRSK